MPYIPRNPERIDLILERLKVAWKKYPDMRLGQLLAVCTESSNIAGVEDVDLLAGIERYIKSMPDIGNL
ncbi:hypothetical protein [Eubacterium sp.]|uniref:hypothetical protein n=1 Tax=Eubacterium sp. TaxID=142586 RepID=UPI00399AD0F4